MSPDYDDDNDSDGSDIASLSALVRTLQEGLGSSSSSDDDDYNDGESNILPSSISNLVQSLVAQYETLDDDNDDDGSSDDSDDSDDEMKDGLGDLVQKVKRQYEGLERLSIQAAKRKTTAETIMNDDDDSQFPSIKEKNPSFASTMDGSFKFLDDLNDLQHPNNARESYSSTHTASMHDTIHSITLRGIFPLDGPMQEQQQEQQQQPQQKSRIVPFESNHTISSQADSSSMSYRLKKQQLRGNRTSGSSSMMGMDSKSFHDSDLDLALNDEASKDDSIDLLSDNLSSVEDLKDHDRFHASSGVGHISMTFRSEDLDRALSDDDDFDDDDGRSSSTPCDSDSSEANTVPTNLSPSGRASLRKSPSNSKNMHEKISKKKMSDSEKSFTAIRVQSPPATKVKRSPPPSSAKARMIASPSHGSKVVESTKEIKKLPTAPKGKRFNREEVLSTKVKSFAPNKKEESTSKVIVKQRSPVRSAHAKETMKELPVAAKEKNSPKSPRKRRTKKEEKSLEKKSPEVMRSPRLRKRNKAGVVMVQSPHVKVASKSPVGVKSPKLQMQNIVDRMQDLENGDDEESQSNLKSAQLRRRNMETKEEMTKLKSIEEPFLECHEDFEVPLVGPIQMISFSSGGGLPMDEDTSISSSSSEDEYETEYSSEGMGSSSSSSSSSTGSTSSEESGSQVQAPQHQESSDESSSEELNDQHGVSKRLELAVDQYETDTSVDFETDSEHFSDVVNENSALPPPAAAIQQETARRNSAYEGVIKRSNRSLGQKAGRRNSGYEGAPQQKAGRRNSGFEGAPQQKAVRRNSGFEGATTEATRRNSGYEGETKTSHRSLQQQKAVRRNSGFEGATKKASRRNSGYNGEPKTSSRSLQQQKAVRRNSGFDGATKKATRRNSGYDGELKTSSRSLQQQQAVRRNSGFEGATKKATRRNSGYEGEIKTSSRLLQQQKAVRRNSGYEGEMKTPNRSLQRRMSRRNSGFEGAMKRKMSAVIQQLPKVSYDSDEYETDGDASVKKRMNAVFRQIPSRSYESDSDSTYSSDRLHHQEKNRSRRDHLSDGSTSVAYTDDEDESIVVSSESESDEPLIASTKRFTQRAKDGDDSSSDGYEFDDELLILVDSSDASSGSSAQYTDESEPVENDREYYEKLDRITRREDELAVRNERIKRKFYIASAVICIIVLALILLFTVAPLKEGFLGDGDDRRLRGSTRKI